jgi:hypothetical protein
MKIKITLLVSFLIISVNTFCQQIGDGRAVEITDFSVPLKSGVYQGSLPTGMNPDTQVYGWQHLFVIRHSNDANNHQLQLSSSYTMNDRLFFRKIAGGLEPNNPAWIELATRGTNSFIGDQNIVGNLGIGSTDPKFQTKLYVKENGISNSIWRGRIVASGDINAVVMGEYNGKAWLGAHNSQLNGWSDLIIQGDGGRIGVGTANPSAKFEINTTTPGLTSFKTIGVNGYMIVDNVGSGENYYNATNFQEFQIGGAAKMRINSNGYIGIGTTNPTSLLTVAGNINSREVKVTVDAGADFVFEKEYNLPSLASLDTYIKENKHLPEIASAKEMQTNGINLSEMNIKLLQKVEELTLYTIEQEKRNNIQSKKIEALEKENQAFKSLSERLSKLENQSKQEEKQLNHSTRI